MKAFIIVLTIVMIAVLGVGIVACTSSSSSTNPPPTDSQTFGALSKSGASVYSGKCETCHATGGTGGIGPPLWGSNANLGTYSGATVFNKDAQSMYNFIAAQMPLSAPGSLSEADYTEVLAYILIQNNYVSDSTTFNRSQLSSITWK